MHWIANFENGKSPCRVNQAAAAVGQFIYSFGGYCQHQTVNDLKFYSPIDVYVLNTLSFKWSKRPRPKIKEQQYLLTPYFRYGHTCCVYNGFIYLWGGRADWTNSLCNTLYSYDPNKHIWSKIATDGNRPDGRDGHTATVIEEQDQMLIFGGYVQSVKKFSNDIYEYNFKTAVWTMIVPKTATRPYWRDFHTASAVDNKLYVFGGRMDYGRETFTGESFYSNDLCMYDTQRKEWTEIKKDTLSNALTLGSSESQPKMFSPCGRRSHSAVVHKRKIIIFGGFEEHYNKHFNDLHEFNVDTWEWSVCSFNGLAPSPRRRHSCCLVNDKMFLFGGTGPSMPSNSKNLRSIQNPMEPTLRQLELDLNQINSVLRDQNNTNINNLLNQVVGLAQEALERRRPENEPHPDESSNSNFNENIRNNNHLAPEDVDRIAQYRTFIQNYIINQLQPQDEFQENNHELQEYQGDVDNLETNNHSANLGNENTNNNSENNNYIVEVLEDENIFGNDEEFIDSGDEDLIDEGSDVEDFDMGLVSLSDLHILDLEGKHKPS